MEPRSPDDFIRANELKEYTRTIIDSIGVCASLKAWQPKAYHFFYLLFQRHPEAERKGVAHIVDIQIRRHPKGGHIFIIVLDNGTIDTISWVACVMRKSQTLKHKQTQAFRVAIDHQISNFRAATHTRCALCNSNTNLEVDHVVHFAKLVYDFMKIHPNCPIELEKNEHQQSCFSDTDSEYRDAWWKYHSVHAILRILCAKCNRQREQWLAPE
jgi:5-methylcytosine-specific restriction endonuclease McrA